MQNKNLYIVLGINNKANFKEIKSAYRILAKKLHPDKNPGNITAEEHFKEVQYAYSTLSNPEKRRKYDLKFFKQHNHYNQYKGNAYQYAQEQANQQSQQHNQYDTPTSTPRKQYRTEINQIIISVIVALILLYFIFSY